MDQVDALVLTHGHEDHIGAVPYLLRLRSDIPIIGSKLTLAFLDAKLKEHRLSPPVQEVKEGDRITAGSFDLEFVAVTHSIPDALAVFVRTSAGTILNTGDFKMDQLPLDGRVTDLRSFARFGEEGVDLFMVDSTNAACARASRRTRRRSRRPSTASSTSARAASSSRRSRATCTASSRSWTRPPPTGAASPSRAAPWCATWASPPSLGSSRSPTASSSTPRPRTTFRATRSSSWRRARRASRWRRSAASRIGDYKVSAERGDVVILASSLIPGNENAVYRVINGLARLGATVVHQGVARVHVSGHASAGELLYCYNILRPKNVMPIHGEVRHQLANGALAVQTGIAPENVMMADDGVVVDVRDGVAKIVGAVPCHYVYVDGASVGELTDAELKDRRLLSEQGFVSIFAVVDSTTGTVVSGPTIHARGVAEDDSVFDAVLPDITAALEDAAKGGGVDAQQLQQVMRRTLGRFIGTKLRRRPMIIPVVVEA